MFTGIIEDIGTIERVEVGFEGGRRLTIRSGFSPASLHTGDSIATSGVCLTATAVEGSRFTVDVGPETLHRTTLGRVVCGAHVNLERSVTLETRLGGHLVQGHVDAVGRLVRVSKRENAFDLEVEAPEDLLRLAVPRGSIAIDGISLTITDRSSKTLSVSIIPHTWQRTAISERKPGDEVNLEADLIARYVAALCAPTRHAAPVEVGREELLAAFLGPGGLRRED